ncbi:phosphate ABC transporter substrate-binding/OmpA family protein [Pseudomonas sp. 148P]|uniref:Phosphate ABC transporter substrate-binding/OmpA family protein n=1 Tax=Pseudomonas ulcerans TaxID=3115852 RepID=A0ABU7HXM7_9PSED|nr:MULTISPECIES: phosphate ABC transporter substrate-binding/OmpA family protein [unclassified Pseudomonas]MEE1924826.1 phosphate ABC transporter substrate-binding/OmpA family protein [Pseudomonas sp. 147P]MEE1936322.1 phosphate ABC transporter substrate-binding/OmpA family protein [Pseudomonas sp. 148P]
MIRPCALLLALLAPLAVADTLRIQGSNTIGAALAPALVRGLLESRGIRDIRSEPGTQPNEVRILGGDIQVDIAAHGSSTGFIALKTGSADLAAASRPIKDSEAADLQALGNLTGADAEQVIALDGVAVLVHPDNPLPQLTIEQLAQVFSGQVSTWEQLGVGGGPIQLYARDDRSGTWETFKTLVLDPHRETLSNKAKRFESGEELAEAVRQDRHAIGFSSLSTVHGARVLAVADGASRAMLPSPEQIASEDYPLSRRLYFYLPPAQSNPLARALLDFTQGPRGQAIVASNGFIDQRVRTISEATQTDMPPSYRRLSAEAQRLSVNFRFQEGSATLDNKALRDVQRVVEYLKQNRKLDRKVVLVGFGDAKDDARRADLLSRLRAMAVRRELVREGVVLRDVIGLGAELPVAANTDAQGRIRNRRVEAWVY